MLNATHTEMMSPGGTDQIKTTLDYIPIPGTLRILDAQKNEIAKDKALTPKVGSLVGELITGSGIDYETGAVWMDLRHNVSEVYAFYAVSNRNPAPPASDLHKLKGESDPSPGVTFATPGKVLVRYRDLESYVVDVCKTLQHSRALLALVGTDEAWDVVAQIDALLKASDLPIETVAEPKLEGFEGSFN
jgi:hypothetical protein